MRNDLLWSLVCFAVVAGGCRDEPVTLVDGGDVGVPGADLGGAADLVGDRQAMGDAAADATGDIGTDGSAGDLPGDLAADAGIDSGGADTSGPELGRDTSGPADVGLACGPGAPREMLCLSYCDGIGRFCGGTSVQYRNADECRAACNAPLWACGQPGDVTGNTLFCRLAHMVLAGVGAAATECPNAGPNSPVCQ